MRAASGSAEGQARTAENPAQECRDGPGTSLSVELQPRGALEHVFEKLRVIECVVRVAVSHERHRVSIAMRVTDPRGVERKLRASARLDLALRRCQGDPRRPWAQDAATRVGQELEKCEPDYVGVVDEERNDFGNLVEVAIEDRGVEHDRKVEPAHALDVFLAQGVQRHLAGIPLRCCVRST